MFARVKLDDFNWALAKFKQGMNFSATVETAVRLGFHGTEDSSCTILGFDSV
jgi:hypothetical protein